MVLIMHNSSIPAVTRAMAQGGRMSLPVEPSALIYSHFKHVSGIAAPEGINGVSISKLNLLDVLIGRLNQLKSSSSPAPFGGAGLDSLIESYNNKVREARAESAAMPYISSANAAASGLLFRVSV